MKLLDAIAIGLEILTMAEQAKEMGTPIPVNWSRKIGKRRLRLKGNLTSEPAE